MDTFNETQYEELIQSFENNMTINIRRPIALKLKFHVGDFKFGLKLLEEVKMVVLLMTLLLSQKITKKNKKKAILMNNIITHMNLY